MLPGKAGGKGTRAERSERLKSTLGYTYWTERRLLLLAMMMATEVSHECMSYAIDLTSDLVRWSLNCLPKTDLDMAGRK